MNQQQPIHWRAPRSAPHHLCSNPTHLGQLLHFLSNAFEQRTLAKCHKRGHRKFRGSHSSVIAQLDAEGLCLGDLAERIGISQQATGKLVRDLERAGYVGSHPDSRDKRSRIIQLTASGAALQSDIADILREIRDEYLEILGDPGLQNFEQQLRNAADALTQEKPSG
jgi:MarR family transcriptional regulator, temperature-dependent positive regulator of motility